MPSQDVCGQHNLQIRTMLVEAMSCRLMVFSFWIREILVCIFECELMLKGCNKKCLCWFSWQEGFTPIMSKSPVVLILHPTIVTTEGTMYNQRCVIMIIAQTFHVHLGILYHALTSMSILCFKIQSSPDSKAHHGSKQACFHNRHSFIYKLNHYEHTFILIGQQHTSMHQVSGIRPSILRVSEHPLPQDGFRRRR